MKTETLARTVGGVVGAAVMVGGLFAFTLQAGAAQDPNQARPPAGGPRVGGPGRAGGPGGPGGPMGRGGRMGGPMGIDQRDLTDAQREQIRAIRERHAEEIKPLADRANNARQALAAAVISGSGDLRGLSVEVGNAETELVLANAQIETEVLGVLTPEQKQKIQDRQKEMQARRAEMEQRRQSRGAGNGK